MLDFCSHQIVPYAIQRLQAAGYKLVTVAECLGMPAYQSVSAPGVRDVGIFTYFHYVHWLYISIPVLLEMLRNSVCIISNSFHHATSSNFPLSSRTSSFSGLFRTFYQWTHLINYLEDNPTTDSFVIYLSVVQTLYFLDYWRLHLASSLLRICYDDTSFSFGYAGFSPISGVM